ncbi:OLC1v1029382C1 [Oldenlandia corymbosa var. corymbosa]|uniref:OLC1v1029382C1 n=1 Tax=Oldenlandia corymbosa var. corymbosa TaxID=529605 RepID=A0AAV1CEF3_OLDCO|nr:OLC1v1029382C1 [Oldenlandia corymbosa var. corymbosa]
MSEPPFTIQISTNLVNQLAEESVKAKKKTKKPKPELPREPRNPQKSQSKQLSDDSEVVSAPPPTGWLQSPLYMPLPPQQSSQAELDAIRSVLKESENVVERLQKQEENLLKEVTERAKDLHDKEFKLPQQKPVPCLDKLEACKQCYNENKNAPLKCRFVVGSYADCVNKVRQLVYSNDK